MRWLRRGVLALLVLVMGFLGLVFGTEYRPASVEPVTGSCKGEGKALPSGQPLTVLSWNVQFSGSRKYKFFYEGGPAVGVPEETVRETVKGISEVIQGLSPDLVMLQEVDRDSARTHHIDQHALIQAGAGLPCEMSTPYWRSPYVPTPSHERVGEVDMHLSLFSKAPLQQGQRTALALLKENRIVQAFNLKRALLTAEIPVEGLSQPLAVATTHLSAFSYGDGSMEDQVQTLADWMAARPADQPWILAGDMNLLPAGDDPKRLGEDAKLYADDPNPVALLTDRFQEAYGDRALDPSVRTWAAFGSSEPDRKIDWVFYGGPVYLIDATVLREHYMLSDHLPQRLTIQLGTPPAPPAPQPDPFANPVMPEGAAAPAN